MTNIHRDKILILDFGAQYTQLIARRIREIGVYCEIWAWDHDPAEIAAFGARGIVLSGRSEEHTSELQSLMRISYAVFCLKQTKLTVQITTTHYIIPILQNKKNQ